MSGLIAYPVAFGATLATTLALLAVSGLHARFVTGAPVESALLPMIFLFVPLIFFTSAFANIAGVAAGQLASVFAPAARGWAVAAVSGLSVVAGCAYSQNRLAGLSQGPQPLPIGPVALFCLTDMLILLGSLSLLPGPILT